jgi:hypothetical protein
MIQKLSCETLPSIGEGRFAKCVDHALEQVEIDCKERPNELKPRKVVVTIVVTPTSAVGEELETVDVAFDVKHSIPMMRTRPYSMLASARKPGLFFQEMSPDDPKQTSFEDGQEAPKGPRKVADAR